MKLFARLARVSIGRAREGVHWANYLTLREFLDIDACGSGKVYTDWRKKYPVILT